MPYQSWELAGVYILRWGLRPAPDDVETQLDEMARAHARQGKRLVALYIMPPESEPPDDAFRRKQAEYLPRFFEHIECAIAVFEGDGFMASLKRSALVAILLLSRKRFPVFVRSSLAQALVTDPPRRFDFDGAETLAAIERLERGAASERQLKRA